MKSLHVIIVFMFLITLNVTRGQINQLHYHVADSLVLGGEGGWDYCIVDSVAERLYISRGMRVQVVDLVKKEVVGEIQNTAGVHGIAIVRSAGKGYTSNGRDSSVTVFDLTNLKILRTIKIKERNPDAILFEPVTNRIFTFNGGSSNATAIDVVSDSEIGTVPLSGKPEFAVCDGKTIFVNIEDKNLITAFDAETLKALKSWPTAPGEEPSGLAIDREHNLLFSVCGNKCMVISDSKSGKVVTTVPIDEGPDAASFDTQSQLAFSSNGSGTLTIIREENPNKFSVAEIVPTRRGARTHAIDEKTHNIYMLSAKFGPPPAPTVERPHPRPVIEPGSVTLFILTR